MGFKGAVVRGVVRNGVVVPDESDQLPEGARVGIVLTPPATDGDLRAELAAWDHASANAWDMINVWEREGL